MSKRRIPVRATELRDQLFLAAAGIGGELDWPPTAPSQPDVTIEANDLHNAIIAVEDLKAQLTIARAELREKRDEARLTMQQIDEMTDALYGPDGTQKNNYGLPPKKTSPGASAPLVQPIILKIADGVSPASIFLDWDTQEGAAAYQVEWFFTSTMTGAPMGSVAVSESEYEIPGLQSKQQYWIRVRAVRGSQFSAWSNPATRVANL